MGYILSAASLFVIAIAMLARANDLGWTKAWVMRARLIGCILAGFAPWGIVGWDYYVMRQPPSLFAVLFYIGCTLVFVTSPHLPPFWRWISGWLPEEWQERRAP